MAMSVHPRVKVSLKGNTFIVKNFLDLPSYDQTWYEKESIQGDAHGTVVIMQLFSTVLTGMDSLTYGSLNTSDKIKISEAWHKISLGKHEGEEPDIVY